jgi:hypothetical protein
MLSVIVSIQDQRAATALSTPPPSVDGGRPRKHHSSSRGNEVDEIIVECMLGFMVLLPVVVVLAVKLGGRYYLEQGALASTSPDDANNYVLALPPGPGLDVMARYTVEEVRGHLLADGSRSSQFTSSAHFLHYGITILFDAQREGASPTRYERPLGDEDLERRALQRGDLRQAHRAARWWRA